LAIESYDFISGSCNGNITIWDWITKYPSEPLISRVEIFKDHTTHVNSIAITSDGLKIVFDNHNNNINIWDILTRQSLILEGHSNRIYSVVISHDNKKIVSGSSDCSIKIWDISTGQLLISIYGHNNSVYSVVFSICDLKIISGGNDCNIKIWDTNTGQLITTLKSHTNSVNCIAVSNCGLKFASCSSDTHIKVWDAITYNRLLTLYCQRKVLCVAFSHDDLNIVSACYNFMYVWNSETGHLLSSLCSHSNWIGGVTFSPDNRQIISGSEDGTIKIWDTATNNLLVTLNEPKYVNSIVFGQTQKYNKINCRMAEFIKARTKQ
jgi:WD40 repeat protein